MKYNILNQISKSKVDIRKKLSSKIRSLRTDCWYT